jgi:hypothetical protein
MPLNTTHKVKERKQAVLKLLADSCKTTGHIVKTLGLTHSEAYYVLEMLKNEGLVVKGIFGKVAVWCLNDDQFKSTISELMREIRRIVESNKLKYVYPMRIYKLILNDSKAYALLSRYVPVGTAVTLAFLNAILEMLYGKPYFVGEKTVYLTTVNTEAPNPAP